MVHNNMRSLVLLLVALALMRARADDGARVLGEQHVANGTTLSLALLPYLEDSTLGYISLHLQSTLHTTALIEVTCPGSHGGKRALFAQLALFPGEALYKLFEFEDADATYYASRCDVVINTISDGIIRYDLSQGARYALPFWRALLGLGMIAAIL